MEKIAEMTQLVFQETQIVDIPVPQIMEEIVEREQITLMRWNRSSSPLVFQLVPQERIQERFAEQIVDIPLPQIMEEILFSSTYAAESYRRTDRGRLHSQDSGADCGNPVDSTRAHFRAHP